MDAFDKSVIGAAFGCVVALAIWKGSRENIGFSLCGLFVIVAMVHYANEASEPWSFFIWGLGFAVLGIGKSLADLYWKRKSSKEAKIEAASK